MTLYLIQIIILHFIKLNKHESYLEIIMETVGMAESLREQALWMFNRS